MAGLYDNETGEYREAPWLFDGLWLEDDNRNLWIIPDETNGIAEIDGSDDVQFEEGPYKGKCVLDVLYEIADSQSALNPNDWEVNWEDLGLTAIADCLKRFNPIDGLYHA